MLTIRFDRLGVQPGDLVLDAGAGFGRHAFELARLGANVVALDYAADEVVTTRGTFGAMVEAGEIAEARYVGVLQGDATRLPFADATFDRVITSEVLEHIQDDVAAIAELVRVLKPGGLFCASVPRRWPERICWALSADYHEVPGGHLRIFRGNELRREIESLGFDHYHRHWAHALHVPFWWLKCLFWSQQDSNWLVRQYHRLLVWDIMEQPAVTRAMEKIMNPVMGKSVVMYFRKGAAS